MPIARVENGAVLEQRPIELTDVPEHKRSLWLPVVIEGSGDLSDTIIEPDKVRIVRSPRLVTVDDVVRERERRLALGFNYDFQDARGVHRIGTTESDMKGWDEVSKYAGALIDAGQLETQIAIATDTGACTVTPVEWRAVEIASAAFRQPIWAKSFALMAMNPIPADFAHDRYWA
jgi:hypothetical protein